MRARQRQHAAPAPSAPGPCSREHWTVLPPPAPFPPNPRACSETPAAGSNSSVHCPVPFSPPRPPGPQSSPRPPPPAAQQTGTPAWQHQAEQPQARPRSFSSLSRPPPLLPLPSPSDAVQPNPSPFTLLHIPVAPSIAPRCLLRPRTFDPVGASPFVKRAPQFVSPSRSFSFFSLSPSLASRPTRTPRLDNASRPHFPTPTPPALPNCR
jgi:hypothetical protein